jgi:hypothetical protein
MSATAEAEQLQPGAPEFGKSAVAHHEAAHAVIHAREGQTLKSVRIWRAGAHWLGKTLLDGGEVIMLHEPHRLLARLRQIIAGRRGELLFERDCCLRVGLDELAYSLIMVMAVFPRLNLDPEKDYGRTWGTCKCRARLGAELASIVAGALFLNFRLDGGPALRTFVANLLLRGRGAR